MRKTINMSRRLSTHDVLTELFDVTRDSRDIFKDTAIIQTEYVRDINSYPAIFLPFVDIKGDKGNVIMQMKFQLLKEYKKSEQVPEHIDRLEKFGFDLVWMICPIYKMALYRQPQILSTF